MACSCVCTVRSRTLAVLQLSLSEFQSGGGGREGEDRVRSRLRGLFYPVCALTTLNALVFSLRLVTNILNNFSECTVTPNRFAFRGLSCSFNPVERTLLPQRTSTMAGYYDTTSEPTLAQTATYKYARMQTSICAIQCFSLFF